MVGISGNNQPQPKPARQPNRVIATLRGRNLPDSVLRVKNQASLILCYNPALCKRIHIARL
jgi:hypothetical protein